MFVFKTILKICIFIFSTTIYAESFSDLLIKAKVENRPILSVVLGPKECPWSQILKETILNDPKFTQSLNDVLIWINQDPTQEDYPIFLLLDPQGREFARFKDFSLTAEESGKRVKDLIDDFEKICIFFSRQPIVFCEEEFKQLYSKAKMLSATCYRDFIRDLGVKQEIGNYFHLEKYAFLLEKLNVTHPVVLKFKQKILKRNRSENADLAFTLASLEFQKLSALKFSNEKVMQPLTSYLSRYGKKTVKNCYQAEMMIAEFLCAKKLFSQALKYAQAAFKRMPAENTIKDLIEWIEEQKKT